MAPPPATTSRPASSRAPTISLAVTLTLTPIPITFTVTPTPTFTPTRTRTRTRTLSQVRVFALSNVPRRARASAALEARFCALPEVSKEVRKKERKQVSKNEYACYLWEGYTVATRPELRHTSGAKSCVACSPCSSCNNPSTCLPLYLLTTGGGAVGGARRVGRPRPDALAGARRRGAQVEAQELPPLPAPAS